ncbi:MULTISPECIES: hypothetical protein [Frankia]|jgi:hypothetical protein|uniref:hypothetical protein n=1 Tax=Frankia TaxID=1854 RepID=UPI0002D3887C|nr:MULTISPECIES: hypothetical protein [Frankia]OFB43705.1 hypothetical protein Manayef4_10935 [Frankia sp. CgIM4]
MLCTRSARISTRGPGDPSAPLAPGERTAGFPGERLCPHQPQLRPGRGRAARGHWHIETGNKQPKTYLRGPGKVLRSKHPDTVYQEIWGYLLTHHAISALRCRAATAAGIDPDRIKFPRTVMIIRDRVVTDPVFPP